MESSFKKKLSMIYSMMILIWKQELFLGVVVWTWKHKMMNRKRNIRKPKKGEPTSNFAYDGDLENDGDDVVEELVFEANDTKVLSVQRLASFLESYKPHPPSHIRILIFNLHRMRLRKLDLWLLGKW